MQIVRRGVVAEAQIEVLCPVVVERQVLRRGLLAEGQILRLGAVVEGQIPLVFDPGVEV
jgi:hypothetical protein